MSFQYRFDILLRLRERERDEAGAAVGQANAAIAKIDQQMQEVEQTRVGLKQAMSGESLTGNVSVDRMLQGGRYDLQLQGDLQSLADTRGKLVQELQRRQEVLKTAQIEVKRWEKLKEIDQQRYREQQNHREQLELDEAASRNFQRAAATGHDTETLDDGRD
ncbi:flagellar export protein FliJ [Crateriforma conspicua]|uniref:Flagellar FliJ protein n=1 Tax=Crateriforma conspicua TaxID=2527996 RepID=A0A5C5Y6K3_9PLAN|nr:flagellar export protein FliJ [Crateriforma conspicua]QDV65877.1 flagellar biosynthesis chaperone [Crateriforma conspicua]TWT71277.1 flagellar biosynthesis chaperone [Crateriforma conspicua]